MGIIKGIFLRKAFSLIELIAVIAIIAILTAFITPVTFVAIEKSRVSRIAADCTVFKNAALNMYADTGQWPGSNWGDDSDDDLLAPADHGEGFTFKGDDPQMSNKWNGPYVEQLPKNPWGGKYWWDYNEADQNGDGIGREHVLWIDNGRENAGKRIPDKARRRLDEILDDGDLSTGRIQVWQGTNFGYILLQGY